MMIFTQANQISVIPLRFRRFQDVVPNVPNAIHISDNEQILIVPTDQIENSLDQLQEITNNGIT